MAEVELPNAEELTEHARETFTKLDFGPFGARRAKTMIGRKRSHLAGRFEVCTSLESTRARMLRCPIYR
jgi:hypothetical protein